MIQHIDQNIVDKINERLIAGEEQIVVNGHPLSPAKIADLLANERTTLTLETMTTVAARSSPGLHGWEIGLSFPFLFIFFEASP